MNNKSNIKMDYKRILNIGGAGATFYEQFALPTYVGGGVIAIFATLTVLLGLNKIVDVIGKIGPIIVVISIALGAITLFRNTDGLASAPAVIPTLNLTHASNNWFMAAGSYVGFSMLMLAGFLSSIGATANSKKEGAYGAMLGATGFSTAIIIVALGFMSCVGDIADTLIPSLVLAKNISPLLAIVFSGIIIAGIYTTAVPLLWSVSVRFTEDKSKKFRSLTIILAIIGLGIGLWIPFDRLVNMVYVINGNIGFILLLLMLVKSIRVRMSNRVLPLQPEVANQ